MSNYLFDTNLPSEIIKPRPEERVLRWVTQLTPDRAWISVISLGELRSGFESAPAQKRRLWLEGWFQEQLLPMFAGRVLPVTQPIAERWGLLAAQRRLRGRPLAPADGLIAATALVHGLTLVSRNVKDFDHLGLSVINPWEL